MRVLLYEWNSIGKQDLQDALINLGHHVDVIPYQFRDFFDDNEFENRMKELLLVNSYNCFISFNFFPILSKVCNEYHLKYIAWVWDSPLIFQFFNIVNLPFNYIFIFDKGLYQELKQLGVNTVYHMPLAANVNRLDNLTFTAADYSVYNHDVSFVGSLYENRNHFDMIPYLPDYLKGYFDAMMKAQMKIQGYNFIKEMLTEDIIKEFSKFVTIKESKDYIGDMTSLAADLFFNAKITELERNHLLTLLSQKFPFTLYTDSKNVNLPNAEVFGYADYYTVMPKIFRLSKININITLRTIRTGIPLRIFDVLGAGGFLITNYQSELNDYFELDKDLVCYESEEDLIQKVDYYLKHEEERKQIALNGYQKVKNNHTYEFTLNKILNIAFPLKSEYLYDCFKDKENIKDKGNIKDKVFLMDDVHEKAEDLTAPNINLDDLKQKLQSLVDTGLIEEAGKLCHESYRLSSDLSYSKEFFFMDDVFNICIYEKKIGLKDIFEIKNSLEEAQNLIKNLAFLISNIENDIKDDIKDKNTKLMQNKSDGNNNRRDNETEFIEFVKNNQISNYAIQYLIYKYSKCKIRLLNQTAMIFHNHNISTMVIPFLMKANELDEKDKDTLYNIASVLMDWKEYDMATEYIQKIDEKSEKVISLINRLYKENT
jgi:spore maturation protein CgeB